MTLEMDKCFKLTFRGDYSKFFLQGLALISTKVIKDLGVYSKFFLQGLALNSTKVIKDLGVYSKFFLQGVALNSTKVIKDLGVYVSDNLSWRAHISARMKKANCLLFAQKEHFL